MRCDFGVAPCLDYFTAAPLDPRRKARMPALNVCQTNSSESWSLSPQLTHSNLLCLYRKWGTSFGPMSHPDTYRLACVCLHGTPYSVPQRRYVFLILPARARCIQAHLRKSRAWHSDQLQLSKEAS